MSVLIKICGLKSFEALDVALEAGADLVGFVFFSPSPRHVGADTARALCERVRGRAQKVALSVDASDDELAASIDALTPDLLQLHGRETPERVAAVRARFGLPVMKALPVETAADLSALPGYAAVADRILFDARAPKGATRPGGLGAAFDWHVLENLDLKLPFMVSGGLDAGNVAEAVRVTRAGGVDVSSGVESAPGVKDPEARHRTQAGRVRQGREERMTVQQLNSFRTGPDERGHFGLYGGRFVAETLMPLVLELETAYAAAKNDPLFRREMDGYLKDYVGRPT
ncbi:MAG: phosphoribosylanthranilate isomerase, partial [Alphaproteobacteria bacterium]